MDKLPRILADNKDTDELTQDEMFEYIKNAYPNLSFHDWTYGTTKHYRFGYVRPSGYNWYIQLESNNYGTKYVITANRSLTGGSITLHLKTRENVRTVIDHAIAYLSKDAAKKNKKIKKANMAKLGKAGQIKKKLKEISPNLTFEATKYGSYRFSNIHNGFLFTIAKTRVADREYRDDLEKMKPLFEWLGTMADVKPMPKNGLIKYNKGLF
jgi:hypothetical protein